LSDSSNAKTKLAQENADSRFHLSQVMRPSSMRLLVRVLFVL
jgi:hypothetical protein